MVDRLGDERAPAVGGEQVPAGRTEVVRAEGLGVQTRDAVLLTASSFVLHAGERVLLVGASGAGKSLFADLLLGFAGRASNGLEVTGRLALDGDDLLDLGPEARDHRLGAVFQLHALGLFDDLTVAENLRFGSPDREARERTAEHLRLAHTGRPVTACSGGERMRIALARTVLRGAGVLLFDEPTTGLDPAAKAQVVAAVRSSHQRLTIVITHDVAAFREDADAVLFIDPATRRIERLAPDAAAFARIEQGLQAPVTSPPPATPRRRPFGTRVRAGLDALATALGTLALDVGALLLLPWCWLRLFHPLDGPRLRGTLRRDLAPGVFAFTALSAALVAMTGTYFLFERLPLREWTGPLVQEDLVTGLGLLFTRVGVPLMISVLLAAKLGAAAAAHLGHMSVTRQVDALRLLSVDPRRHLLLPTATGQLAAAWATTAVALGLAFVTSLVVFLARHPGWSARYFAHAYGQELAPGDFLWIAAKVAVSALGVAAVAFRVGTRPTRSPQDVIKGVHATLLRGLVLVILVHAVFAFLEF